MVKKKKAGAEGSLKRRFAEAISKGDLKAFETMLTNIGDAGQPTINAAGSDESGTPFLQVCSPRVHIRVGVLAGGWQKRATKSRWCRTGEARGDDAQCTHKMKYEFARAQTQPCRHT